MYIYYEKLCSLNDIWNSTQGQPQTYMIHPKHSTPDEGEFRNKPGKLKYY